jgi:hypothetical protein
VRSGAPVRLSVMVKVLARTVLLILRSRAAASRRMQAGVAGCM